MSKAPENVHADGILIQTEDKMIHQFYNFDNFEEFNQKFNENWRSMGEQRRV